MTNASSADDAFDDASVLQDATAAPRPSANGAAARRARAPTAVPDGAADAPPSEQISLYQVFRAGAGMYRQVAATLDHLADHVEHMQALDTHFRQLIHHGRQGLRLVGAFLRRRRLANAVVSGGKDIP